MFVRPVVSTRFNNVDLSGARPRAILACLGKHPDSGPKPITFRELCSNFNSTILDVGTLLGIDAPRPDGRDDSVVSSGQIGGSNAVGPNFGSTGAVLEKVDDIVLLQQL